MNVGSLRKRLTFSSKSGTPNSFGEVTGYSPYYTCYGSVDIHKGQLLYNTGEFIGQNVYTISIRYTGTHTFNIADRITTEDGTLFEIQAVLNPQMRNRVIQILAYTINQQVA